MSNPRNIKLQVRFNRIEFDKISKKAESSGLEVGTFLRLLGLESKVKVEGELKTKD